MSRVWEIYAQRLASPDWGRPMWFPEPSDQFGAVHVGDVGYLYEGRFQFLFNSMDPAGNPRNVRGEPHGYTPFQLPPNPFDRQTIPPTTLMSTGLRTINASITGGMDSQTLPQASVSGGTRYSCTEGSGALLILKQPGHRKSLSVDCEPAIQEYILQHMTSWHTFAMERLGTKAPKEAEIIFVFDCTKTTVWAEAVYENKASRGELRVSTSGLFPFKLSFSLAKSEQQSTLHERRGPPKRVTTIRWVSAIFSVLLSTVWKADQCIFMNYYTMKRKKFRAPSVMRAAAGPHELPDDDPSGGDPTAPVAEIPSSADEWVHPNADEPEGGCIMEQIMDYILQHSDADVAFASDRDVAMFYKIQSATECHQQDVKNVLRRSGVKVIVKNGIGVLSENKSVTPDAHGALEGNPTDDANVIPELMEPDAASASSTSGTSAASSPRSDASASSRMEEPLLSTHKNTLQNQRRVQPGNKLRRLTTKLLGNMKRANHGRRSL